MTRKLFPNFPLSQSPARDPALTDLLKRHGSWLELLDPAKELPSGLSADLKRISYSIDELKAARAFLDRDRRQMLILQSASLLRSMRSTGDTRLQSAQYEKLLAELSELLVTEAEIEYAIEHILPFVEGWKA